MTSGTTMTRSFRICHNLFHYISWLYLHSHLHFITLPYRFTLIPFFFHLYSYSIYHTCITFLHISHPLSFLPSLSLSSFASVLYVALIRRAKWWCGIIRTERLMMSLAAFFVFDEVEYSEGSCWAKRRGRERGWIMIAMIFPSLYTIP